MKQQIKLQLIDAHALSTPSFVWQVILSVFPKFANINFIASQPQYMLEGLVSCPDPVYTGGMGTMHLELGRPPLK